MFQLYTVLILASFTITACLKSGDFCISKNKTRGICTAIFNCPSAISLIRSQEYPQICGFSGLDPVVCCHDVLHFAIQNSTSSNAASEPTEPRLYSNPYKPNTTGYKSFQKCVEFSNLIISHEASLITGTNRADTCGFVSRDLPHSRRKTNERELPHMVILGFNSSEGVQWLCGGTLLNEWYVLTAGHCLYSRSSGQVTQVRMGILRIEDEENRQQIAVEEIIQYEGFNPPSFYNDIGLLKLEKPVQFNRYVRPACLHLNTKPVNGMALASGWSNSDHEGLQNNNLEEETLTLVDADKCNSSFYKVPPRRLGGGISETIQICAENTNIFDACKGDSGGPLQIHSDIECMYEVIGITSFGKACGVGSSITVYTRVSYYLDWIEKIIWS